jgi:hypothetical protein
VGCVEYDTGNRHAAETTRQAALSLGTEADHSEIVAWAHEMRAWINLTTGDYNGVVAATLMVSRDLTKVLNERYSAEAETRDYLDQLGELAPVPSRPS